MTSLQAILIAVILIPLILAALDKIRMDLAAILMAVTLGLMQLAGLGMLGAADEPQEAIQSIAGFSQPTVIILISLFILTRGLEKTGVTRWVAQNITRGGMNSEGRLIALFAGVTAALSLVMNNLAAGALVLPSALETSRRTGIHPSKLLMPVAYGSLLGGAATYFTTANIVVSDLLRIAKPPQTALNFLDFFPAGSLIAISGILYLALLGKKLLPDRTPEDFISFSSKTQDEMANHFQLDDRIWEARVTPTSPLVGQTLAETYFGEQYGLVVVGLWHGNQTVFAPAAEQTLSAGDRLLIVGREERVKQFSKQGLIIEQQTRNAMYASQGGILLEMIPSPHSDVLGKTLKELDFRNQYGYTVVALRRMERSYRTNVGDIPLNFGDELLLAGPAAQLKMLQKHSDFFLLEPNPADLPVEGRKAFFILAILLAAITASILGVPTYLATLCGALAVMITGVVNIEESYHSVEWQAIFLIAGMYAVSQAMIETGLARLFGDSMIRLAQPFGALGLVAGAYLITALLTQGMGGQVTALVTGPITISAAISMGVNPQAVAVATAIGCSASFLTPMAHPVNILMIAPAGYRFKDFFRVGWPLTILSFVALLAGMKFFWGF